MFRKSIRTKLLVLLLLAAVLPTGISMAVSYLYIKQSVTEKSIKENTRLLALGEANLTNYFSGVNELALSIYSGINLPNSLYTAVLNTKAANHSRVDADFLRNRDLMVNQLYNLFQSNKDIYQIHFYIRANHQSNSLLKGLYRRETNEQFVPPMVAEGRSRPFLEATHLDHRYGLKFGIPNEKTGKTQVFSVHFPIFRAPSDEVMADLSIDLRVTALEEISKPIFDPETEHLYILNDQGSAMFSSDSGMIGKPVRAGWNKMVTTRQSGHFAWKDRSFDGIVFFNHIDGPLLKGVLIKLVPYDDLYGDARTITRINAVIGLLFLIIGVLAVILISFRFTTPIKKLIAFTQKVQTGQFDARVEAEAEDEIGLLTRKITDMTQTINNLILKEYRLEIANKTNQLKALQAQINPHFLYNALQSIASLSLRYNASKVYDLIYSLGSIMRYTMTTEKSEVPLQSELDHVQNYLLLQKERFGDGLAFSFDVEPQTRMISVPKMILQPIVENIFKHAFEDGVVDARVSIQCRMQSDSSLVITVSNNGKGLPVSRIQEIEASIAEKNKLQEDGIGLWNVLMRLRLYFGEEAGLSLRANEEAGLTVTLTIPIAPHSGHQEGENP